MKHFPCTCVLLSPQNVVEGLNILGGPQTSTSYLIFFIKCCSTAALLQTRERRLNTTLFCPKTFKYGTFVAKVWIPRGDSSLISQRYWYICCELTPHFIFCSVSQGNKLSSGYSMSQKVPMFLVITPQGAPSEISIVHAHPTGWQNLALLQRQKNP